MNNLWYLTNIAPYFNNNTRYAQLLHPFNGPFSQSIRVSRYQKGQTNPDFTEARDSEWQWHQLHHMQVYTSLQTDNLTSTSPLSFLQAGCPFCHPTNSIKALKAKDMHSYYVVTHARTHAPTNSYINFSVTNTFLQSLTTTHIFL